MSLERVNFIRVLPHIIDSLVVLCKAAMFPSLFQKQLRESCDADTRVHLLKQSGEHLWSRDRLFHEVLTFDYAQPLDDASALELIMRASERIHQEPLFLSERGELAQGVFRMLLTSQRALLDDCQAVRITVNDKPYLGLTQLNVPLQAALHVNVEVLPTTSLQQIAHTFAPAQTHWLRDFAVLAGVSTTVACARLLLKANVK